jgi:hypothetical protein
VSVCTCERSESWVCVCSGHACTAVTVHHHTSMARRQTMSHAQCWHTHLHSWRSGNKNSSHFSTLEKRSKKSPPSVIFVRAVVTHWVVRVVRASGSRCLRHGRLSPRRRWWMGGSASLYSGGTGTARRRCGQGLSHKGKLSISLSFCVHLIC